MGTTTNIAGQIESALREDNAELLKPFLKSKDRQDLLINYREPNTGRTLMALAAEQGRLEIVRFLLTVLDVNVTLRNNVTPLMLAAKNNHLELVKLLLEKGANVNAINSGKLSALHFACRNGHEEIVKLLYQHGASIFNEIRESVKTFADRTFEKVFTAGKTNIMHTIVDCEKKYKRQVYDEVLFTAIECDIIEFVELMLDRGVSIEEIFSVAEDKLTPLMLAVRKSQPFDEMVKLLLERGASVTKIDYVHGYTALHYAAIGNESTNTMQLLLEHGADVNATCFLNQTPLYVAVDNTRKEATKFLLRSGADVNIEGRVTPIFFRRYIDDIREYISPINRPHTASLAEKQELEKIVIKYIVKLQSEGLSVSEDGLMKRITYDKIDKVFHSECKKEIDKIKATKNFSDSHFSLYDVFKAKDVLQLAAYAKNREMADYFTSDEFRKDFPMYSETILENLNKGARRNYLQARVCNFFTNLFTRKEDKLPRLPVLCASEVFSYLSDRDLRNLRKAYY